MRYLLFLLFFGNSLLLSAQNMEEVKKNIKILCSDSLAGRGYTRNGVEKASNFLAKEYQNIGLRTFNEKFIEKNEESKKNEIENYFQLFSHSINTFPPQNIVFQPYKQKSLTIGRDFIVDADCPSIKGDFPVLWLDTLLFTNETAKTKFLKQPLKKYFLVFDIKWKKNIINLLKTEKIDILEQTLGSIELHTKLTASVSTKQSKKPVFQVLKQSFNPKSKKFYCEVKANFLEKYNSKNIVGYTKGTIQPDSFIVFSAHYDHLGGMGNIFFPGANDNASGVSMLLELAKYYQKTPSKYSIAFILFAGEEAGLLGSQFYTENPLFALTQIKFLMNLDLVGTGDDGATIVNGSIFTKEFEILEKINFNKKLLPKIQKRGKAANSDHYFFSEKGVKAFFLYALGGIKAYHDIDDTAEKLPLTRYKELFELFITFVEKI
jgi:aminopeptidase YwaD